MRNNWNHLKRCSVLPETFPLPLHSSMAVWIFNLELKIHQRVVGGRKTRQNLALPKAGEVPKETNHLIIIIRADSKGLFLPSSWWGSSFFPITLNAESFLCIAVLYRKPLEGKGNGKRRESFSERLLVVLTGLKVFVLNGLKLATW